MTDTQPFELRSTDLDSDHVQKLYCEPCYEVKKDIKHVTGYCQNCEKDLCFECYTGHGRQKDFHAHKVVVKYTRPKTKSTLQTTVNSLSIQKAKVPYHCFDINVKADNTQLYRALLLPNRRILITASSVWQYQSVILFDITQDKVISEIQLNDNPFDITNVKDDEFAVTSDNPENKIQFLSLSQNILSKGREISVKGQCKRIAYNKKDQTLIVAYPTLGKVETLNMTGDVVKCLDKDSTGAPLFTTPVNIVLSRTMTEMYISDCGKRSVILMTMSGDVKAVYKNNSLETIYDICVHDTGLIYVVDIHSHSVHQLDQNTGKFKRILEMEDGIIHPSCISYCHLEDKIYIGMCGQSVLKVFQLE